MRPIFLPEPKKLSRTKQKKKKKKKKKKHAMLRYAY